jgi:CRP-like cAMP-binding protein
MRVCQEMVWAKATGRYVFQQGEIGSCFFIVFKGKVEVEIDEKLVRSLEKGQTFG